MSERRIPDGQQIVIDYLVDALDDVEVVSETPDDRRDPWVRITQLDAPEDEATGIDYQVEFWLQIDCCAGTRARTDASVAADLARDVRLALTAIRNHQPEGAVVTDKHINGDADIRDEDFKPAMPRRVLTVSVWMHSVAVA